jgi:hypothetical protein
MSPMGSKQFWLQSNWKKFLKSPCANAFFTSNCYTGLDHFVIGIKHGLIKILDIKKQIGLVSNGNLEVDATNAMQSHLLGAMFTLMLSTARTWSSRIVCRRTGFVDELLGSHLAWKAFL